MRALILLISGLVIAACGGGGVGGDASPTDPNQTFTLSVLQTMTMGTVYASNFRGSDSNGVNYAGSYSIVNRTKTMLNGVLTTPQDEILSVTGGGMAIPLIRTTYVDTSGNLIYIENQTKGQTCSSISPDKLPGSVRIGDSGTLSILTCSHNITQERSWRVEDAGNGNILVVTNSTTKDQLSMDLEVTDITYTINGNGSIVTLKIVTTDITKDYTLTLQSA